MSNKKDTHIRSVVKTISWRFVATFTTTFLVFIFTGSFTLAIEVGFIEMILKLLFYYSHERVWNLVKWGKL